MTQIIGRQMKYKHARRCDFCNKPKSFGYMVKMGPTQGFFCGPRCLKLANARMQELKAKVGVPDEGKID